MPVAEDKKRVSVTLKRTTLKKAKREAESRNLKLATRLAQVIEDHYQKK